VEGDDVAGGEEFVERGQAHLESSGALFGDEWVVRDDLHSEGQGAACDLGADASEADDAQALAVEFSAHELLARPLASLHAGVGLGEAPGQGEDHRQGEFAGRDGVSAGGVHHQDAAAGGGLEVNVVHARPGPSDDLEALGALEEFGRDLCAATHYQGVGVAQESGEVREWRACRLDDLEAGTLEDRDALGIQRVADDDLGWLCHRHTLALALLVPGPPQHTLRPHPAQPPKPITNNL